MSTPAPTVAHLAEPAGGSPAITIRRAWLDQVDTDRFQFTTSRAAATHVFEDDGAGTLRPVTMAAAVDPAKFAYRVAADTYTVYGV